MKCNNCGFESEQDFDVCSACGRAVEQEYVTINLAKEKILPALKDKLFLVICILMTVSCSLSILNGNIPVIDILLTVFSWLVYASAQKDIADTKNLRCVSGTVYANYVIMNVLAVILVVCGLLIGVSFSAYSNNMDIIIDAIGEMDEATQLAFDMVSDGLGWVIAVFFIVVAGIILAINLFGYRKIHRFAKSIYVSIENHNPDMIESADAARAWLWVFAVVGAIGSILGAADSDVLALISSGCGVAIMIIAAILVKRYASNT